MLIKTKYLEDVEVFEEDIISFPYGLLGFENHHKFVILDIPGNNHFKLLQDVNHSYLGFLLISPWDFFNDYEMDIPDESLSKIGINPIHDNKIEVYNIVTVSGTFQESTTNLIAPIVINSRDKIGKQFILNDSIYTTKHKLFPEGIGE